MKKIFWSGLVAGVAMLVVSIVISYAFGWLFPSVMAEYENGMYRAWSEPLMQLFFLGPILLGFVLAYIWDLFKGLPIKCKCCCDKGIHFGLLYWLVSLTGMLITYATFRMSVLMLLSWVVAVLVQALVAGWVLEKMNK